MKTKRLNFVHSFPEREVHYSSLPDIDLLLLLIQVSDNRLQLKITEKESYLILARFISVETFNSKGL